MPEDSKSRKERLKALRQVAQEAQDAHAAGQSEEIHAKADVPEASEAPLLKFRNYALKDANIEHKKLEPARVKEFEEPKVNLEEAIGIEPEEVLANVAPKKANWDLRREIANKLARLERKTQQAIAELALEEEKKRLNS
eukprot:jgi/Picsp_1/2566/NSC_00797-R1_coiled-coil domain-containing protein 12